MCLWHNKSSEPHLSVRLSLSNSAPHGSWWLLLISRIPGLHHFHHHYPLLLLNTVLSRAESQFEEGRVCMIKSKLTRLWCNANIIHPLPVAVYLLRRAGHPDDFRTGQPQIQPLTPPVNCILYQWGIARSNQKWVKKLLWHRLHPRLYVHWWTYRCRRRLPKITLKATRQNVYFKNTRRRWREINLEEEVLIFKRLRKYVYVKKEA